MFLRTSADADACWDGHNHSASFNVSARNSACKMQRTRTDEQTFSNIQNSLEFVPKSGADRDLLFRTADGDAPTAFKVQLVPESSPETSVPNTMVSRPPLGPDQHVPHVVRMRILGLTGIAVDESQPDRVGSPPNPPPKYMKSVVAVTRQLTLHGTSPLSKRLVRAPNQRSKNSTNDSQQQHQRYIAIWDNCNDHASTTNSLTFEANLPPEKPIELGSEDLPRRSTPHRNYELIVGLTTSKKQKPTPVGVVGLPLEEATRLRSKHGKIVLDLPVVNFARLSSDPFATKSSDLPPKRQLSLRRTFSSASYSLPPPSHPSKMEQAEFDQQQTSVALGHNCFMDPAKDAAVLRIELDIQKKAVEKGAKIPNKVQEASVVLVQPKSDAIELAHTLAKPPKSDSVAQLLCKEPLLERIPHGAPEGGQDDCGRSSSVRSSQYRVKIVDAKSDDCAISLVKLPDGEIDESTGVPVEISSDAVADVPKTISVANTTEDCEEREQPEEESRVERIVAIAPEEPEYCGEIEHTLEESKAKMKTPKPYQVLSQFFHHAAKKSRVTELQKVEEPSSPSCLERSSIPSVEQATLGSESDSPSFRLIDKIKVRPSPPRQLETVTPSPSPVVVPEFPLLPTHEGPQDSQVESPEDPDESVETDEEEETGALSAIAMMKDRLRPYTETVEKFFEDDDDEGENDSWSPDFPRTDQLKENFNEFVGVLDDICQPMDLAEEQGRAVDAPFAKKSNWVSAVLNDVSFSDGSSCDSASTITYDETHLVIDDVVEQEGEEVIMPQVQMNKTWSTRWPMRRNDSEIGTRETKPRRMMPKSRTFSPSRAVPPVPKVPNRLVPTDKRFERTEDRCPKPRDAPKANKPKVVITMTDTNGERKVDQYSKPLAEFSKAKDLTPVVQPELMDSPSPLCFGNSMVDVVSKALTPKPDISKEKPTTQKDGEAINGDRVEFPPIPDMLVTHRDMQSVGDLTATSHEIQVEMAEFKHLIKQHLAEAKKPKEGKGNNLSFVKSDADLYANVDDSWCKGV